MRTSILTLLLLIPILSYGQKQGRSLADSLLKAIDVAKKDTTLVIIYDKLSFAYARINSDSGLLFAYEAMRFSEELGWEKGVGNAYADMGINYSAKSEYPKALELYEKAITVYKKLGLKRSEAAILSNIALIHHKQSNYADALTYYLQALEIMELLDDKNSCAVVLENIGTLHKEQNDYTRTIRYYSEAIKINTELNNKPGLARNLGNMGIVYDANGNYKRALESHFSAYETNKDIGNMHGMQINLANIGIVYLHMGQLQQAVRKLHEALSISEELRDKTSMAINAGNLGETYYTLARQTGSAVHQQHAIEYLDRAVSLCMETNALAPAAEFVKYLADAYVLSGDYRKAHKYQKMLTDIKDRVYSVQSKLEIANLENKREVALKQKNLELKDKQIKIAQLELERSRAQQALYILGIAFLSIVLIFTIKSIIAYRKSNRQLSNEKKLHMGTILTQNMEIKARNRILEEMAHKHSHDIRGHVATILGLSQMLNRRDHTDATNATIIDGIAESAEALDDVIREIVSKENELTSLK